MVLPSGSDDERISLRVVAGRNTADCTANLQSGCIEARRSLGFVPHTPLFLPLELAKSCENVVCDNASDTCSAGQCVPSNIVCSGGCSSPGTDAGLLDVTTLKDVISAKDVISVFDAVLDDAPILLDGAIPLCLPPAPDAGVSTYTWHFDEGVGLTTSEANKALPDASLAGGATFVPGAGLGCKTALSPGGTNVSLGSSAPLAAASFRVDLWIQTTKANAPILTLKDFNSTTQAWGLSVLNGSVSATFCSSGCTILNSTGLVNDGAWHSVTLVRASGGTVGLSVDGNTPVSTSPAFKPATLGQLVVSFSGAVDELHFTAGQ